MTAHFVDFRNLRVFTLIPCVFERYPWNINLSPVNPDAAAATKAADGPGID